MHESWIDVSGGNIFHHTFQKQISHPEWDEDEEEKIMDSK